MATTICAALAKPKRLAVKVMAVRVDRAPIGQAGDSTAFETCRPAHFPSSMSGVLGVAGFDADSTSACISVARSAPPFAPIFRSEEHTSELQSLMRISYAVFCLKKKHNQLQSFVQLKTTQD